MDNLCEIYYENLINCDVLLTGKKDAQEIWGMLRNEILVKKLLDNYIPPLVLSFPILKGPDGTYLSTLSDANSISIRSTKEELKNFTEGCSEYFLDLLFSFLIIPWKTKIEVNKREIYTYEELHKNLPLSEIRNLAYYYIDKYFYNIRGTEL